MRSVWKKEKKEVNDRQYIVSYKVFMSLMPYHTVLTFKGPKEEDFGKDCKKRSKCWSSCGPEYRPVKETAQIGMDRCTGHCHITMIFKSSVKYHTNSESVCIRGKKTKML